MLQVEGPKIRTKGRNRWEIVQVQLLVQGYLGCLGSTWNANLNMILQHPNVLMIVTICH